MNVVRLVEMALDSGNFDGLYCDGICACRKGDINPGECITSDCQAGYLSTHSQDPEKWVIGRNANKSDEEIENILTMCS